MHSLLLIVVGLMGMMIVAVAFALGYQVRRRVAQRALSAAEAAAQQRLEAAQREATQVQQQAELAAKEWLLRTRQEFEQQTKETRQALTAGERRLVQHEENLDRKVTLFEKKERELGEREQRAVAVERVLVDRQQAVDQLLRQERERLQSITSLTPEAAKQLLLTKMEGEVRREAGLLIKRVDEETAADAQRRARVILVQAMQRCASEFTVESSVSVIHLPNEEMKGRIIGREGRNIRAFEQALGVDVIIDETPETVTLSAFDMLRREQARIVLERLMADGRIHPARIEEMAEKVRQEMEETIRQEGARAVEECSIVGLHPELMRLLGRLRYRTSYSQNVLVHLKECSSLATVMAAELGLDPALARRAALLHDIGKAVSHEIEGPHALVGAELARKYGESADVVHAIEAHHHEVEPRTVIAVLTQVADAVSGSRPGARGDTLEQYVKRLQALETLAESFRGVEKSYAIQAGREVRVMVQPERVTDLEAVALARDIRKRIEESLQFPGQIKVTVIRETRAVEFAR